MGTGRARRYRQHSAADKVAILRQVLLEGQAVSTVCEEHDVSPTLFYAWQKWGRVGRQPNDAWRRGKTLPRPSRLGRH